MDAISYSYADKQAKRIKKIINDPDSTSGIVTVPKVIASGENITVPAGRVAVLPNVQVDGTLNVLGEVFIPAGSTFGDLEKGLMPTGSIIANPSMTIPTGFLECNGAQLSRVTYSTLFSILGETYGVGDGSTTFNIPDLRGEFIRGFDNGRGVDVGRVFGSWQNHQIQNHTHNYGAGHSDNGDGAGYGLLNFASYNLRVDSWNVSPSANVGVETRPRNISMMYCIKY